MSSKKKIIVIGSIIITIVVIAIITIIIVNKKNNQKRKDNIESAYQSLVKNVERYNNIREDAKLIINEFYYSTIEDEYDNDIKLFEIDKKEMINDKIKRLEKNNIEHSHVSFINCDFTKDNWINNILLSDYLTNKLSFSSLLGIIYYLQKAEFKKMIHNISNIVSKDSYILFDYPTYEESKEASITSKLAKGANEKMKAKYSYGEIENILLENGFIVCKYLDYKQMSDLYFYKYNSVNPDNQIFAPKGVNYCLAMKKLKLFDTFFE